MKQLSLLASVCTLLAAGQAGAASLSLLPAGTSVIEGESFALELELDARDAPGAHPGRHGGYVLVSFDPTLLDFDSFILTDDGLAAGDLDKLRFLSEPALGTAGAQQTVTFGFENAVDLATVGLLTFTALGDPGISATIGLADADDFSGSFVAQLPTEQRFYPTFNGASITITAVPLPAGAWMLGTAVVALGWRAARRIGAGRGPRGADRASHPAESSCA